MGTVFTIFVLSVMVCVVAIVYSINKHSGD